MKILSLKKILTGCLLTIICWPLMGQAADTKNIYPRLANHFLRWEISDSEADELAKWDLLVLDMEVQENSRRELEKIRRLNPNVIILAYITSQEIIDGIENYNGAYLRQALAAGLSDGWWLRDGLGNKISNWPYTSMFNLSDGALPDISGRRFNDYLPEFVANTIKDSGLWDGVFYDNTWGDVSWVKATNFDLDNDGKAETASQADAMWAKGFYKMLAKTRELTGPDFIIIGNGRVYEGYQKLLNGMMLESFPSPWENGGSWTGSMETYLKLPSLNVVPALSIIHIYDKNQNSYKHARFGLTSTLMGQGYFSYDYDVANHGQTWWYDEYDVELGPAKTAPYNLLAGDNTKITPGLWRRDFRNGTAIVNSTTKKQTFVFKNEELVKIKGTQDSKINNGQRINYIILEPQDGVVLLKETTDIYNSPFVNGYFYRIFDQSGRQQRNGFFAYSGAYPGGSAVILASGSRDNQTAINVSASRGWVTLYQDGQAIASFPPYTKAYKQDIRLAARLDDGYFNKIVTGAGPGGGPQVRVFTPVGRLEGSWFAYDKSLRGGVNVALADLDGDGSLEVITGPGAGEEPRIKMFTKKGELLGSFLAYDAKFRGGVNVAAGDLNGDGRAEIVTAPASGGGPHVMIFNNDGQRLSSWFAYDKDSRGNFEVSVSDINNDGQLEVLVGIKSF